MKNKSRKGFTIVELVIVIAVIAILAAVLIPTFSNVISKANESAALQEATNAYEEAYALAMSSDGKTVSEEHTVGNFTFTWDANGDVTVTALAGFGYDVTVDDGKVTVTVTAD